MITGGDKIKVNNIWLSLYIVLHDEITGQYWHLQECIKDYSRGKLVYQQKDWNQPSYS